MFSPSIKGGEELKELESLGVSEITQAINAYYEIIASEEFRELERLREKALRDEARALSKARKKERKKCQGIIAEKDAALSEKNATLSEMDAALSEKDAVVAGLRKQVDSRS